MIKKHMCSKTKVSREKFVHWCSQLTAALASVQLFAMATEYISYHTPLVTTPTIKRKTKNKTSALLGNHAIENIKLKTLSLNIKAIRLSWPF